jgi:hypothetical protein
MDILAAIKREERKLEKQLGKLQQRWNGVRAAAKVLGDSTNRELTGMKAFKASTSRCTLSITARKELYKGSHGDPLAMAAFGLESSAFAVPSLSASVLPFII